MRDRHRLIVTALAVAAMALGIVLAVIGVRGNDLARIADANCQSINRLIERRNTAAESGRETMRRLLTTNRAEPLTAKERRQLEEFLDALFYTVQPSDC